MSGSSIIATKVAASASQPLVRLIRFLALCVVAIGLLKMALVLPGIVQHLWHDEGSLAGRFSGAFGSLSGPLRFSATGAIVHVVTQISFGRRKKRTPFDFRSLLGNYIDSESAAKAFNRRVVGGMCLVGGPLLSLVGNATMRAGGKAPDPVLGIVLFVAGFAIFLISLWVFLTGLRNLAPRAESLLRRSKRSPILYLRSFQSDAGLLDRGGIGAVFKMVFLGPMAHQTIEHALTLAVKDFRPLVAIGQPGERLPPLGAARLYASKDWQQVVANLTAASPLVILRIGSTEGFWWEVEHLVKTCDPRKVLIYLPQRDRGATYQHWRERVSTYLPHPLPLRPGRAMFLAFGPGWKPYLLGVNGPSLGAWCRRLLGGRAPEIREALNIHLRQLGANPTRLPLLGREWFLMLLLALSTLSIVIGVIRA